MNKLLFLLLLILAIGLYIFNIDQSITQKFRFVNDIKKYYLEKLIVVQNGIEKYFFQVSTIESLSKENDELKKYKILFEKSENELNTYSKLTNDLDKTQIELTLVKVLSYVNFDDQTKVWLDRKKEDEKIEGLISENYAAGIVINQSNHALALLNGNDKSNYAVFIGENRAPGIIHGMLNSNMIIAKYVPIWMNINVGDEVITSGLDDIFFEGLKVGIVKSIKKMPDMQEATIEPYVNASNKGYFYIYSKKILEKKEEKVFNKKP